MLFPTDSQNNFLYKEDSLLDRLSYRLILFLVVFTPFEDFLLKFLPVSDRLYFYARFLSEVFIYILFAAVVAQKLIKKAPFFKTPLDLPLVIFIGIVLMSAMANKANIFASIMSIRPVIRYIILFYLIVNINITLTRVNTIIRYFIYVGTAQLGIGFIQFLSRGAINDFLKPRASEADIGGVTKHYTLLAGREIGSIYGTTGDTVLYGTFMILFLILIISKMYIANQEIIKHDKSYFVKISSKKKNIFYSILILGTLVAIGLTYVRVCLLASLIILMAYSLLKLYNKNKKSIGLVLILISLLIPIISINIDFLKSFNGPQYQGNARETEQTVIDNVTGIFTERYINIARQQRLGALTDIPLTVIYNKPFLGYGPDQLLTIKNLNNSPTSFLTKEWTQEGFKDVYWVAIVAFYGVAGLFTTIWIFYRLYRWARTIYNRSKKKVIKEISLFVMTTTLSTVLLLFFNRTIEFRIYSLYFWLLPGLMFNLYSKEKLTAFGGGAYKLRDKSFSRM